MSCGVPRTRRVTYKQQQILCEFLKEHREIAVGYNKSTYDREHSKRQWAQVTKVLNSCEDGAKKSGSGWSKYWVDLKAKLKKKVKQNDVTNEQGQITTDAQFSEVEMKLLSILNTEHGNNIVGGQAFPVSEKVNLHSNDIPSREDSPAFSSSTGSEDLSDIIIEPQTAKTTNNIRQKIIKRKLQRRSLTATAAIHKLISAAQTRAQAERANSEAIKRAVLILGEMTAVLKRIEGRLTLDGLTSD